MKTGYAYPADPSSAPVTPTLRMVALCAGYGGLDLAVESLLPVETVAFAEFAAAPAAVFARHWPGIPNLRDVTTIDWPTLGQVDVLTAGYPCQPFSHAGKRQGENDARHLWPAIRDAVRVLRPGYLVCENVAGHLSLGFDRVLADLAGPRVLRAVDCSSSCRRGRPPRPKAAVLRCYRRHAHRTPPGRGSTARVGRTCGRRSACCRLRERTPTGQAGRP